MAATLPGSESSLRAKNAGARVARRASLAERFGAIADAPGDKDDDRLQHRVLLYGGFMMAVAGAVWGSLSVIFGLPTQGLIPFAYTVLTALNFLFVRYTKRFAFARALQIGASLLLPVAFMWSLGGFRTSGAMMLWSLMSLIASLALSRLREQIAWCALFIALSIVSGLVEGSLPVPPSLGEGVGTVFFTINMVGVGFAIFALSVYFLGGRRSAIEALAVKNAELAVSQQALVQREKMAALGQLVSGVAHELNTPLGAIRASVFNLENATQQILVNLPELLSAATPSEVVGLRRLLAAAGSAGNALTSREERQLRKGFSAELGSRGVERPEHVADLLVEIGVRGAIADHLETLTAPNGGKLLASAHDITALQRSGNNIRVASDRAAKIVFALKSYAHPGAREGELESGAIADHLETVVTLYQNQIKHGVELVRTYQDRGELLARHDELNQVWTNLLHNALQAMGPRGRLELRIEADSDTVRVAVEDNGAGIPPDVMGRLFEPFFTTKAKGEGTGLGLSICLKIVQEHGGRIDVESAPGRTVFCVSLPRRGSGGAGEAIAVASAPAGTTPTEGS